MKPFPVLLFDSSYWKGLLNWLEKDVLSKGYISEEDLHLLRVCDHVDEVVEAVQSWHIKHEVTGRKALLR